MAGLNHTARQQFLDYCPELKMLFPVRNNHTPSRYGYTPVTLLPLLPLLETLISCNSSLRDYSLAHLLPCMIGRHIYIAILAISIFFYTHIHTHDSCSLSYWLYVWLTNCSYNWLPVSDTLLLFYQQVLHYPDCFGAEPNPLLCIQALCENGGIRCAEEIIKQKKQQTQVQSQQSNQPQKGISIHMEWFNVRRNITMRLSLQEILPWSQKTLLSTNNIALLVCLFPDNVCCEGSLLKRFNRIITNIESTCSVRIHGHETRLIMLHCEVL